MVVWHTNTYNVNVFLVSIKVIKKIIIYRILFILIKLQNLLQ